MQILFIIIAHNKKTRKFIRQSGNSCTRKVMINYARRIFLINLCFLVSIEYSKIKLFKLFLEFTRSIFETIISFRDLIVFWNGERIWIKKYSLILLYLHRI